LPVSFPNPLHVRSGFFDMAGPAKSPAIRKAWFATKSRWQDMIILDRAGLEGQAASLALSAGSGESR
jgi:hypothetical protein